MKYVSLFLLALTLPLTSQAGNSPQGVTVRCEGINEKRIQVGLDAEFDEIDRLVSLASFEGDSVFNYDIKRLGAPSHYLHVGEKGRLAVFGFKSFNDGLEENLSVLFVEGKPSLTTLMLQDNKGLSYLAKGNIRCRVLK